ncbi:MAG TPA: hypothetical protein VH328_00610 [Burkholderiaceae bacterium]|jgi:hypothetical protein|nr:hypothetical protein [Burkholderiaceae bacterium]
MRLLTKEFKATMLAASLMAGIVVTASTLADGCGKADEIFDCQSVCTRYRDCYDSGYDVDGCRQRCRDNSDSNPSIRQDADTCEACIDDKSCVSAPFTCGASCSSIVP